MDLFGGVKNYALQVDDHLIAVVAQEIIEVNGLFTSVLSDSIDHEFKVRRSAISVFPVSDLPGTSKRSSLSSVHVGVPYYAVP